MVRATVRFRVRVDSRDTPCIAAQGLCVGFRLGFRVWYIRDCINWICD